MGASFTPFEGFVGVDRRGDLVGLDVDEKLVDGIPVDAHSNVRAGRMPDIFNIRNDVAKVGLFDTRFDDSRRRFRDLVRKVAGDDRC